MTEINRVFRFRAPNIRTCSNRGVGKQVAFYFDPIRCQPSPIDFDLPSKIDVADWDMASHSIRSINAGRSHPKQPVPGTSVPTFEGYLSIKRYMRPTSHERPLLDLANPGVRCLKPVFPADARRSISSFRPD